MKARRKSDGQWVDVYYSGENYKDTFYKVYGSEVEYTRKELVFEDAEKINSYWFNFRNQAAMAAMQGLLSQPPVTIHTPNSIKATLDVSFEESTAQIAVKIAYALVAELQKKTD